MPSLNRAEGCAGIAQRGVITDLVPLRPHTIRSTNVFTGSSGSSACFSWAPGGGSKQPFRVRRTLARHDLGFVGRRWSPCTFGRPAAIRGTITRSRRPLPPSGSRSTRSASIARCRPTSTGRGRTWRLVEWVGARGRSGSSSCESAGPREGRFMASSHFRVILPTCAADVWNERRRPRHLDRVVCGLRLQGRRRPPAAQRRISQEAIRENHRPDLQHARHMV